MTTLAHRSALRRTEERRRCRPPRGRSLGLAHVPARVAPADPGDRAPHGGCRGRDRQRHGRLQLGARGGCRVRLGRSPAPVRRRRSAPAGGGSRRRRGAARDDRRHRPPLTDRSRRRRQGRVPRPGPARGVRWRALGAPPRQLPERSRRSCRHRRRGHAPGARDREDACPRRPSPDGRRHRREPT